MRLCVDLVEDDYEGKFGLVEYTVGVMSGAWSPGTQQHTYLHAYSMLDINVAGAVARGVSTMYAMTVGIAEATASVMMAPDADHVNISI